ncbi:MAG: NUDIX hydrolase [Clostridia bacterium]|nr:NUDIX hydrolase [Clostridia bacterium]
MIYQDNGRPDLREEIIGREPRFQGALIRVEQWRVRLPDGSPAQREVVKHPGAAAVVAVDAGGFVALVRQHRPAVDELMLELPAGKLDHPGEDPLACAQRELREETGLAAGHWRLLTTMFTTPGFCDERISLYLATGLSEGEARPDTGEFLHVERLPLEEAVSRVLNGEIHDGKTALGLLMAHRVLGDTI